MTPEDVVSDPFVSRDRIPRTPPSGLEKSSLLRTTCSDGARLPDNSQTSMFQTDQNRPRYFIRLRDSPGSQNQGSPLCPSSFDARSVGSEKNANSTTSPGLPHVEDSFKESLASMDFDAADVVAAKTTIRRGRIRGEEKNIRATSLPMGEVTGTPGSHDERESRLEAISITTVAFGTSHTSHFNRPGRGKRQQKPTQSSLPPTSRHNLRRITSCLNGSAPRRGRRCQGDNENDASPSAIPSTSPTTTAVRGERRGECHRLFNSPKLTETSSAILGSPGPPSCRRSQRNVVRVNYAGL